MMQLETATGRIIQIPGEEDQVIESSSCPKESESEDEDQEATELPFACTLCKRRFSRKLHLNNHMERHHGIKYVFTEKGRKVKLVRIPEGFKVVEGELLDPCVQPSLTTFVHLYRVEKSLLETIDKDQIHSIIGVEEIEIDEPDQNNSGNNTSNNNNTNHLSDEEVDDCKRLADLLNGKIDGLFGVGFLFDKINYHAYQVTVEKGEAAFAVFYPPDQPSVYLFRIVAAGEKQHLFLRATKKDVRNAAGAKKEGVNYTIPLVAALKISEDTEMPTMTVEPLPAEKPTKIEIMSFEEFVGYARICQGNGVKSLADSIEISPSPSREPIIVDAAPKKKRKFQRRTTRAILKAESKLGAGDNSFTPETPVRRHQPKVPKKERDSKMQKLRRNLDKTSFDKEFEEEVDDGDDDEEKDASYFPNMNNMKPCKKRGRPPGTKNRPKPKV